MLIVDTFNVLHVDGVLPHHLTGLGVPGLVRLIASSRYANRDLTLVCDGGGSSAQSGVRMDRARILYSGGSREADDVIEDLIEHYHRGNPLEIVSSDRRLRTSARRRRTTCIPSEVFLRHLVADSAKPMQGRGNAMRAQVPLDRYSVDSWMTEFGVAPAPPTPTEPSQPSPLDQTPSPSGAPSPPGMGSQPNNKPIKKRRMRTPPPRPTLGSTLAIEWPTGKNDQPQEKTPKNRPSIVPPVQPPPSAKADEMPAERFEDIDPLLLSALEEWRDRLSLDDLNMQQWTPDATPLKPAHRTPKRR